MKILVRHFIKSLIDWVFRRRSSALIMMRVGLAFFVLAFGAGWVLDVSLPFEDGSARVIFYSSGSTPIVLVYLAGGLGFCLTVAGLIWEFIRYRTERKRLDRKRVIVIEARGLRDTSGTPLFNSIPKNLEGHRDSFLVDIRQRIKDGEITVPEAALEDVISLPSSLRQRENDLDRRDVTLVYGGLTPVPFTFLTGVLIDDEGMVFIFDWDRHAGSWRQLDDTDDGRRFKTTGLDNVLHGTQEIALAVSVSYGINLDDVCAKVGEIPVVALDLEGGSPDCHWSEEKQQALGKQFLDTVISLGNLGVQRIHLFLAAQNSVVFRFGRLYDKRNLPKVVVYQYLKSSTPPYPWGILMPVCGISEPTVVRE